MPHQKGSSDGVDKSKSGAPIPASLFENALSSFTDAVVWMNASAEQLICLPLTHVADGPMTALFPVNTSAHSAITQAMATEVSVTDNDAVYVNRRGESVPVGISVYPLPQEEGRKGAAIVMRDLTALKTMERLASMGERLDELSTLAAGIAHEIKNPLGGIPGAARPF